VFFKQKSTRKSVYVTFVIGNVVLMVVLFYFLLNNVAYDWTGQLYPTGSGFRLDTGLDAIIPFVPEMVVFYIYLFYPLGFLTMLYFSFIEYKLGYELGWSLVAINAIAVLIYIIFPVSTFWYRQELLAQPIVGNFWANQVYNVFGNDSSFNCFPSLHAAVLCMVPLRKNKTRQNHKGSSDCSIDYCCRGNTIDIVHQTTLYCR